MITGPPPRWLDHRSLRIVSGVVMAVLAVHAAPACVSAQSLLERQARLVVWDELRTDALRLLQEKAGVPLVYSPDLLPRDRVSCECRDRTGGRGPRADSGRDGPDVPGHPHAGAHHAGRAFRRRRTATVTGRVVDDESDAPVGSVQARVDTGQGSLADESGRFAIRSVPAGSRRLEVTGIGWAPWVREDVDGARWRYRFGRRATTARARAAAGGHRGAGDVRDPGVGAAGNRSHDYPRRDRDDASARGGRLSLAHAPRRRDGPRHLDTPQRPREPRSGGDGAPGRRGALRAVSPEGLGRGFRHRGSHHAECRGAEGGRIRCGIRRPGRRPAGHDVATAVGPAPEHRQPQREPRVLREPGRLPRRPGQLARFGSGRISGIAHEARRGGPAALAPVLRRLRQGGLSADRRSAAGGSRTSRGGPLPSRRFGMGRDQRRAGHRGRPHPVGLEQ